MESAYVTGAELLDKKVFSMLDILDLLDAEVLHAFNEEGGEIRNYTDTMIDLLYAAKGDKGLILSITRNRPGFETINAEEYFPFNLEVQKLALFSKKEVERVCRSFLFLRSEIEKTLNKNVHSSLLNYRELLRNPNDDSETQAEAQKYRQEESKGGLSQKTLLTVIAGLSRGRLDWGERETTGKLRSMVESAGLEISDDTIVRLKKEMCDFLNKYQS